MGGGLEGGDGGGRPGRRGVSGREGRRQRGAGRLGGFGGRKFKWASMVLGSEKKVKEKRHSLYSQSPFVWCLLRGEGFSSLTHPTRGDPDPGRGRRALEKTGPVGSDQWQAGTDTGKSSGAQTGGARLHFGLLEPFVPGGGSDITPSIKGIASDERKFLRLQN